jgi:hypothetical protein
VAVKKIRVVLRWTGRAFLVLLAILVLFILEENIRGHILLARYEAELRAKGEKLTLAEIELPKSPPGSNGVPALLAAADEVMTNSKAHPLFWYGLGVQVFTSAGHREVLHRQERLVDRRPPPRATPSTGRRLRRGEGEEQPYVPAPPSTCSWDELTKNLAEVSNALENARAAALQPLLGVDLDKEFPRWERIRHLQEWLAASVIEALHRGNLNTALDDITTIVELVRLQKNERIVGVQQGRLSTANLGLHVTWEALQTEGWTDQQLAKLQEIWERAECLSDYVPSMEMDRVTYLRACNRITFKDVVDYYRSQQLDWVDLLAYTYSQLGFKSYLSEDQQHQVREQMQEWVQSLISVAHWLVWRVAWVQQDQLHALRQWSINLNATRVVVKEKSWTAWAVKPERRWTFYDQWRYLLYGTSYDCNTQIHQAVQYETLREMTVAAIALKRYQLRTGTYPSDLSALLPEFLAALPHDWMDGQTLHYRLNADGTFTLYSVGDNGVDDGGDPNPASPRTAFQMWDGRDAVWPAPATQDEVEVWKLKRLQRMQRSRPSQR